MARSNDADASAMASLASARRYAYLSSIVHAEEDDEDDVRTRAMGTLSAMVASVGLDASVARALESVVSGTPSASARAPGTSASLLPEVSMKDFEGYLRRTRERYAEFVEQRAYAAAARATPEERSEARLRRYELEEGVSELSSVPDLFFDETFDLSRPETFARACAGLEDQSLRNLARASMDAQEHLSAHLDTIEQHLIREIIAKSDEFFDALKELRDLHDSMTETQITVGSMRQTVRNIGEHLVKPGQLMIDLNDKRDKMQGLTEKFASIAALQQMRLDMDVFVESTDYPGALQIAEDIRKTLADDRVLAELSCFRKLPEHIERTVSKVRNVMIGDFVAGASLPRDAKAVVSPKTLEHLSKVAAANGLKPPAANFNEAPQFGDKRGNVLDTTIPPFIALLFSGSSFVCDALEAWSSAMSEDVRQIEHVAVDVMLSRVTGERVKSSTTCMEEGVFDSAYANAIRKLPGEVFVEMLVALTETFNAYFERANQIKLVIRGVIGNDEEALTQLRSIDENLILAAHEAATNFDYVCSQTALATSNEALNKVIDIAQGRFAKILGIRAPMNINLSAREFMRIMDATNGFLDLAESLGKHRCLSLRSTVANQSKAFIREQHATASTKLVSLLECETWALAKLPKHFQALVDALADGTSKLPDVMSEDVGDASFVVVADEKFHPVNSAVLLLQMLTDYVRLARQIPSLSTEVTHRTIDLVKQYNTAVCQLILGAGAMQVSKLKSITAKHLCLAQQSVSLFTSLLPTLQEAMCALIEGPKHVLLRQEFERMLRDLKLHKSEIHDKLVSIMRDRVEFHLHRLASIVESLRDEGNVKQVDGASDFAISLTKEMGTLRRVICELLSEDDRRDVLGRVRDEAVASIVSRVQSLESGDNLRIIAQLSVDLDVCADSMKEMPVSGADASEDALASLASAFRLKVPPPVVNEPADDVSAREKEQLGQNKAADDKPSTD